MENLGKKAYSLFFILCTILLFLNDFSQKNTHRVESKKVMIENYIIWKKINIHHFVSNIISFGGNMKNYLYDHKKLVKENQKLHQDIKNLQEIVFINQAFFFEKHRSIYDDFDFYPIHIKRQDKTFYGITINENNILEQNDLIINHCGVIGKISHVGSKVAIIMLNNHPKFSLPVTLESDKNNIGLYSFSKNKILEIKQKNNLFDGDKLLTAKYKNKIPEGILIGKISLRENEQIVESISCQDSSFGFVLKAKLRK